MDQIASKFEKDGYAVIEDFLNEREIETLRSESYRLIREESVKERDLQIFGNDYNARSEYFLTSGDKIRFFFEKKAFDQGKKRLVVPQEQSLAKIGHALHCLNQSFKDVTVSDKMKQVFKEIGFLDPTVVQSMVIFKNPQVGGEYTPHQDASFLCTEPIRLAGVWLALDDATPENGCLEFIPGSHRWTLARRNVRVKREKDALDEGDRTLLEWTAPVQQYEDNQFVSVPVRRGAMVLIHGLVVHRSGPNVSNNARWIYTFHAYDRATSKYLEDNWLQEIDNKTFMPIFNC